MLFLCFFLTSFSQLFSLMFFLSIAVANSFSSHAVADAVTSVAVSDVASSDVAVDSFVELPSVILVSVVWSSTIDTGYVASFADYAIVSVVVVVSSVADDIAYFVDDDVVSDFVAAVVL